MQKQSTDSKLVLKCRSLNTKAKVLILIKLKFNLYQSYNKTNGGFLILSFYH